MFPEEFYKYLAEHTLIEIKGGLNRDSYLPIWMVEVDKRIFARSWNKSKRSWFTEFQKTGIGEIKFCDKVIRVKGKKLSAQDKMNSRISMAYIEKYKQSENLKYAEGISQLKYFDYTMEFFNAVDKK